MEVFALYKRLNIIIIITLIYVDCVKCQGDTLFPYHFNVYMDGLSDALNKSLYGCIAGDRVDNHLMYADDLSIVCPSAKGMSELLKVCEHYVTKHHIKYNSNKSAVVICRNSYVKNVIFSPFTIKGENKKPNRGEKTLPLSTCHNWHKASPGTYTPITAFFPTFYHHVLGLAFSPPLPSERRKLDLLKK